MSLRDEMLKAGLITEEQAKRAAHKQRVDRKRTDPKERTQRKQAAQAEVQRQQQRERTRHQEQARTRNAEAAAKEQQLSEQQRTLSALETAYREGAMPHWEGARRYCYAAQGKVEWIMVSEEAGRRLEQGQAAICASERNPRRHVVLNAAAARRLSEIAPERVVVWHQGS